MFAGLLSRGYLPKELPPAFSSASFGAAAPKLHTQPELMEWEGVAKLTKHNLVRAGTLRRGLAIPNPFPFLRLAHRLSIEWPAVLGKSRTSPLSKSTPTLDVGSNAARAVRSASTYDDLPQIRAASRAGARFICSTDVSNFYSSVYTHSIAWALEGKAAAKANRRGDTLGNSIDKWVRAAQDGQTMGIPIGPDTSHIIAEVVLSAIDVQMRGLRGFRFYDDYEIACASATEAESALSLLQQRMSEFELALNPKKTLVARLPQRLEAEWTSDLRKTELRKPATKQRIDLLTYFDKMADHALRNPEDNVMRYGVATLVKQEIAKTNFELYCSLLLQAASGEPGVLPAVLVSLLAHEQDGLNAPRERLADLLESTVKRHAPLGHGSEVAWALWGALCFGITLSAETGVAVAGMEDSVVALLALDAIHQKRIAGASVANWGRYFVVEELWGDNWLLSYEAAVRGWAGTGHHLKDPVFKRLADANVSFYTPVSSTKAKIEAKATVSKSTPEY